MICNFLKYGNQREKSRFAASQVYCRSHGRDVAERARIPISRAAEVLPLRLLIRGNMKAPFCHSGKIFYQIKLTAAILLNSFNF